MAKISVGSWAGTAAAVTYVAGVAVQYLSMPVALFSRDGTAYALTENFYTDEPAWPTCRCAEGHHAPVLFTYKGYKVEGWLHQNRVEIEGVGSLDAIQYTIEVDPANNHAPYECIAAVDQNARGELRMGQDSYYVLKSSFTLLKPFTNPEDGRLYYTVAGNPVKAVPLDRADKVKAEQSQIAMWKKAAREEFSQRNYGAALADASVSEESLIARTMVDRGLLPIVPSFAILGVAAFLRRGRERVA